MSWGRVAWSGINLIIFGASLTVSEIHQKKLKELQDIYTNI
jgi:hypothetical protein